MNGLIANLAERRSALPREELPVLTAGDDTAAPIDPSADPVFVARKGYYRASALDALQEPPRSPMAFIAAEHTAQINTAQAGEVFSKAEENELLFQDVELGTRGYWP